MTDPFGLCPTAEEIAKIEIRRALHTSLDIIGLLFDEADVLNAIAYAIEGDNVDAAWSLFFTIPVVGSIIGLPFKYAFKLSGNATEGLAKFTKKNAPELAESFGKLKRNAGGKLDDAGRWIQRKSDDVWEWIWKESEDEIGENVLEIPKTVPQQLTRDGQVPVIGKMKDLNTPGNVVDGEFKVADYLPDMGNPKENWHQNSGILRSVMNEGVPIKDVSEYPMNNAGFLGAERNLLQSRGWTYFNGYWYPPQ